MAKKKNIQEAIEEADQALADFVKPRVPMEDYHEIVELTNVLIDLNVHAYMLAVDQNREAFGVAVDQDIAPAILPKASLEEPK